MKNWLGFDCLGQDCKDNHRVSILYVRGVEGVKVGVGVITRRIIWRITSRDTQCSRRVLNGGVYRAGRGMEAHRGGSFTVGAFLDACSRSQRLSVSSGGRGRGSLLLMEGEAMEMFSRLRIMLVASKETEGIKTGG